MCVTLVEKWLFCSSSAVINNRTHTHTLTFTQQSLITHPSVRGSKSTVEKIQISGIGIVYSAQHHFHFTLLLLGRDKTPAFATLIRWASTELYHWHLLLFTQLISLNCTSELLSDQHKAWKRADAKQQICKGLEKMSYAQIESVSHCCKDVALKTHAWRNK